MPKQISILNKRRFLEWLKENESFINKETDYLIQYLIGREYLLSKMRFVECESIDNTPVWLKIATVSGIEENESSLRFNNKEITVQTKDAEEVCRYLGDNKDNFREVFVAIKMKNSFLINEYVEVLEDNPYCPNDTVNILINQYHLEAFLEEIILNNVKKKLNAKIDQALDEQDEKRFMKLTKKLISITY